MRRWMLLVCVTVLLAGCGTVKAPPAQTQELRMCGTETLRHGEGYDGALRDCLWDAYQAGQLAKWVSSLLTVEGDPIVWTVDVLAANKIVAAYDTTKDKFGEQKVTTYTCTRMEKAPVRGGPAQYRFWLTGCTGGPNSELQI